MMSYLNVERLNWGKRCIIERLNWRHSKLAQNPNDPLTILNLVSGLFILAIKSLKFYSVGQNAKCKTRVIM